MERTDLTMNGRAVEQEERIAFEATSAEANDTRGDAGHEVPADEPAAVETADSADEEAAATAAAARERLDAVVDRVRRESRMARVTAPASFLAEPFSYTDEQLSQVLDDMAADPALADIVRTEDEKTGDLYLHSLDSLSVPYVRMLLRSQANDPAFLIAQTVREQSQLYPRAIPVEFFEFDPFNLELAQVFAHLTVMGSLDEYTDIHRVTVSNGMVCLYSDRYLTEPRAQALAQWAEVDSHLNSNQ